MSEQRWEPGDVANGHVLDQGGVWRPLSATVPAVYDVSGQRNDSALAPVAGLICGILAALSFLVPIVSVPFGGLGLTFGIIGLRRGGMEHRLMSWIGIVLAAGGMALSLLVTIWVLYVVSSN